MIGEINMAAVVGATHVVLLRTKTCLAKAKAAGLSSGRLDEAP